MFLSVILLLKTLWTIYGVEYIKGLFDESIFTVIFWVHDAGGFCDHFSVLLIRLKGLVTETRWPLWRSVSAVA